MRGKASLLIGLPLGLVAGATLLRPAHAQQIPTFVNYQGRLTTPVGAPFADGTYSITFRIFEVASGGDAVWTANQSLAVRNGFFATMLGTGDKRFPDGLFSKPLWLETTVEGRALGPRQPLGSVPFAMTALSMPNGTVTTAMIGNLAVTTAKIANGAITEAKLAPDLAVPVGSVVAWYGDSASVPTNWKFCDGTAINVSGSPLNGQTAPDLRDRFIRGASGNVKASVPTGGQDEVTISAEQMPSHNHGVNDPGHSHPIWGNPGYGEGPVNAGRGRMDQNSPLHGWAMGTEASGTNISLQNSGGNRPTPTLPRYVGLIYIMRVK